MDGPGQDHVFPLHVLKLLASALDTVSGQEESLEELDWPEEGF